MKSTIAISNTSVFMTHERIPFLDNLRAIAIIVVVGVHALGLFAMSITLFKKYDYIHSIRKSTIRLLVPLVIFTLFYVIARYGFELSGFLKEFLIVGRSLHEVTISAYGSVIAPHMYFLISLLLIRLCDPILRKIVKIKNYYVLLILFVSYFSLYKAVINIISPYLIIDGGQEPILHVLWGFQYYFAGMIIF